MFTRIQQRIQRTDAAGNRRLAVVLVVVAGTLAIAVWQRRAKQPVGNAPGFSQIKILPAVRVRKENAPLFMAASSAWEHKGASYRMLRLSTSCLDDTGNIYVADVNNRIYQFNAHGEFIRKFPVAAAKAVNQLSCNSRFLWLSDTGEDGVNHSLLKVDLNGNLLWRVAPTKFQKNRNTTRFDEIRRLDRTKDGDVFVYDNYQKVNRFNRDGKAMSSHDVTATENVVPTGSIRPIGWAAVVSQRGIIYSYSRGEVINGRLTRLVLDCQLPDKQKIERVVDLTALESLAAMDILLVTTDVHENLYFQYRYPAGGAEEKWAGPMAIAVAGANNKAEKIVDLYKEYTTRQDLLNDSVSGCGDLLYVSSQPELFVEVGEAGYFRTDRIARK